MNLILAVLAVALVGIFALFVRFKPSPLATTVLADLRALEAKAHTDLANAEAVVLGHVQAIEELLKKKVEAEAAVAHAKSVAIKLAYLTAKPLAGNSVTLSTPVVNPPVLPSPDQVASTLVPPGTSAPTIASLAADLGPRRVTQAPMELTSIFK